MSTTGSAGREHNVIARTVILARGESSRADMITGGDNPVGPTGSTC
ncbi:MAG TPA: hypothetical protein VFQ06_14650 [Nitrospira sp.]|nr:hypothetical protein [Nitrospira sp.]